MFSCQTRAVKSQNWGKFVLTYIWEAYWRCWKAQSLKGWKSKMRIVCIKQLVHRYKTIKWIKVFHHETYFKKYINQQWLNTFPNKVKSHWLMITSMITTLMRIAEEEEKTIQQMKTCVICRLGIIFVNSKFKRLFLKRGKPRA